MQLRQVLIAGVAKIRFICIINSSVAKMKISEQKNYRPGDLQIALLLMAGFVMLDYINNRPDAQITYDSNASYSTMNNQTELTRFIFETTIRLLEQTSAPLKSKELSNLPDKQFYCGIQSEKEQTTKRESEMYSDSDTTIHSMKLSNQIKNFNVYFF